MARSSLEDDFGTLEERVLSDMDSGIEFPPKGEAVVSAFYAGYLSMRAVPAIAQQLDQHVADLPQDIPPSLVGRRFFKRHQAILTMPAVRAETGYPYGFNDVEKWREYFSQYHSSASSPFYQWFNHVIGRPLQTNRPDRAIVPAFGLAAHQMRHDLHRERVVHDWGAGANFVLESLNYSNNLVGVELVGEDRTVASTQTTMFKLVTNLSSFTKGFGIERRPPKTEEDWHLIKADTLEPSQFYHPQMPPDDAANAYEEQFDYLLTMLKDIPDPGKRVRMLRSDINHLNSVTTRTLARNPATIAFMGHVLAGNPRKVADTIKKVLPYMDPNGYILINEYAVIDHNDRQNLIILPHWYQEEWLCITAVLKVSDLARGFIHAFTWKTSDCHEGRASRDIARLSPALEVLADTD